ncbi:MAG: DUF3237 domain-containing protein [Burkholderiaceae bacterium]
MNIPEPKLIFLCEFLVELGTPIEMGEAPRGRRRIIPIIGGEVSGERLSGRILNVGADWQAIYGQNLAELDTRYAMETNDGAVIEIRNFGLRHGPQEVIDALARGETVDPSAYYMRTQPRFETGDPRYDWLNRVIAVGSGARDASAVRLKIFEVA